MQSPVPFSLLVSLPQYLHLDRRYPTFTSPDLEQVGQSTGIEPDDTDVNFSYSGLLQFKHPVIIMLKQYPHLGHSHPLLIFDFF